eukprot:5935464-Heterocapsa_arctica.AAC.1
MKAGALHTILADGVWTPRKHTKDRTTAMDIVCCVEKSMRESTISGGTVLLLTGTQISETSN